MLPCYFQNTKVSKVLFLSISIKEIVDSIVRGAIYIQKAKLARNFTLKLTIMKTERINDSARKTNAGRERERQKL